MKYRVEIIHKRDSLSIEEVNQSLNKNLYKEFEKTFFGYYITSETNELTIINNCIIFKENIGYGSPNIIISKEIEIEIVIINDVQDFYFKKFNEIISTFNSYLTAYEVKLVSI